MLLGKPKTKPKISVHYVLIFLHKHKEDFVEKQREEINSKLSFFLLASVFLLEHWVRRIRDKSSHWWPPSSVKLAGVPFSRKLIDMILIQYILKPFSIKKTKQNKKQHYLFKITLEHYWCLETMSLHLCYIQIRHWMFPHMLCRMTRKPRK